MRTPDSWHHAQATVSITVATAIAYLIIAVLEPRWVGYGAFFTEDWSQGGNFPLALITPLTATLLHVSILNLLFNLLILMFCGRAVEGAIGPVGLVILYIAGAYGAALARVLIDPVSPIPVVGASGAVSAVIGAYAILFGKNRTRIANSKAAMWLNSLWLLMAWVLLQSAMAIVTTGGADFSAAIEAIGGFVIGGMLARPLLLWRYRKA